MTIRFAGLHREAVIPEYYGLTDSPYPIPSFCAFTDGTERAAFSVHRSPPPRRPAKVATELGLYEELSRHADH
jgi:hypothetical protein